MHPDTFSHGVLFRCKAVLFDGCHQHDTLDRGPSLAASPLPRGQAGGLRAIGSDERDFKTGFNAHLWDELERPLQADQSFTKRSQPFTIRETCFFCHSLPGVYSFNRFQSDFRSNMARNDDDRVRPFPLSEMPVSEIAGTAVKWKEGRSNWISLRKLLAD
jgi:hypothetical protein